MPIRVAGLLIAGMVIAGANAEEFRIDCDFPGGNIIVESIDGDTVSLRQDPRDTPGHWFYWYFRVRGAAGRTLTFRFTKGNVIGVLGPALSLDRGVTWTWLGAASVDGASFRYSFPTSADEVRFSMGMPYVEANLRRFLTRYEGNANLKTSVLCKTKKGRDVELLRLGRLDGKCDVRVALTARHHCCEMMASYALEGILASILAGTEDGAWFRNHAEFLVIPFMDKDGVEDGDQGKNRRPHDHNRDYTGESVYASVRAMRDLVPKWSEGKLRFALDMHCPGLRPPGQSEIHFVGNPNQEIWNHVQQFSRILERVQKGPLVFRAEHNLPFGKSWNTAVNLRGGKSFGIWLSEQPEVAVATTIEIPYANAGSRPVTAESARALGADLARAIRLYLKEARR